MPRRGRLLWPVLAVLVLAAALLPRVAPAARWEWLAMSAAGGLLLAEAVDGAWRSWDGCNGSHEQGQ